VQDAQEQSRSRGKAVRQEIQNLLTTIQTNTTKVLPALLLGAAVVIVLCPLSHALICTHVTMDAESLGTAE
jgi:hypothetical protein